MSSETPKIIGANKEKGIMGFKINYPYKGCLYDIARQRYAPVYMRENIVDLDIDWLGFTLSLIGKYEWRDIKDIERTKVVS